MANNISMTIGVNTVTVPIKGTNAKLNAAILRYATHKGIPTDGRTPLEIGTDVLTSLLKIMAEISRDRQRVELLAAQQEALEATIALDNDL